MNDLLKKYNEKRLLAPYVCYVNLSHDLFLSKVDTGDSFKNFSMKLMIPYIKKEHSVRIKGTGEIYDENSKFVNNTNKVPNINIGDIKKQGTYTFVFYPNTLQYCVSVKGEKELVVIHESNKQENVNYNDVYVAICGDANVNGNRYTETVVYFDKLNKIEVLNNNTKIVVFRIKP